MAPLGATTGATKSRSRRSRTQRFGVIFGETVIFLSSSAVVAAACRSLLAVLFDLHEDQCLWTVGATGNRFRAEPGDGSDSLMGINTNNINPELLRFVDREHKYSQMKIPLWSKEVAHPDQAKY